MRLHTTRTRSSMDNFYSRRPSACSFGWFVSLLVREEVLLADLCERKILFWLEIYDRLRQATAKRTGYLHGATQIQPVVKATRPKKHPSEAQAQ